MLGNRLAAIGRLMEVLAKDFGETRHFVYETGPADTFSGVRYTRWAISRPPGPNEIEMAFRDPVRLQVDFKRMIQRHKQQLNHFVTRHNQVWLRG